MVLPQVIRGFKYPAINTSLSSCSVCCVKNKFTGNSLSGNLFIALPTQLATEVDYSSSISQVDLPCPQARFLLYLVKITRLSCGVQLSLKFDVAKQFFCTLCTLQMFLKTVQAATFQKRSRMIYLGDTFAFSGCQDK